MGVPDNDNFYAAPRSNGNTPRQVRRGTPPPFTGAANLAIWLCLVPIFVGLVVAAVLMLMQWRTAG